MEPFPIISSASCNHTRTLSGFLSALTVLCLLFCCSLSAAAQDCDLLPLPKRYSISSDSTSFTPPTVKMVESIEGVPEGNVEGYFLKVSEDGILVECTSPEGEKNAWKTLSQLLSKDGHRLPLCEITDYPAFPIRGWLMDCGRTFISMDELRREIDILSRFKINVFHWHLTENQAFRLESKLHPQVNSPSSMSRCPGQFYTQREARELEEFCLERGVTLIPEIDLPGHSKAFERATGYSMQSPRGKAILMDILGEAAELFRGEYFHIGTDEVPFEDRSLVPEAVSLLRSKGKKVVSWNPGWNYASSLEIDMTQLWSYRGKPTTGVPYIDCRFHYINHFDMFWDMVDVQSSTVYGNGEARKDGAQGAIIALWNDRYIDSEERIVKENALYQSVIALADRLWRGGGYQYFDRKGARLKMDVTDPLTADYLDFERRVVLQKERTSPDFPFLPQGSVVWNITEATDNGGDLAREWDWKGLPSTEVRGAGMYLRHTWGTLIPALLDSPQENSTVYAYTYVLSEEEQDGGLIFLSQNASRSEKDVPPPQGKWDWRDSYVKLNGEEVPPPVWSEDRGKAESEAPMGNLNSPMTSPLPVHLHKGWNELVIKLPVGKFSTPQTRLVKWGFTCILTDRSGDNPLPVVYSTSPR